HPLLPLCAAASGTITPRRAGICRRTHNHRDGLGDVGPKHDGRRRRRRLGAVLGVSLFTSLNTHWLTKYERGALMRLFCVLTGFAWGAPRLPSAGGCLR